MMKRFCMALVMGCMVASQAWAAGFSMTGDDIEFDMESNEGIAKGNVVIVQDESRAIGDFAQFNNKTKTGFLKGNVVADKDGYHITADSLYVYDEDHISAQGNAVLKKDGRILKAPLIDYFKTAQKLDTGKGRSTLLDTDGSTVEADEIHYNRNDGLVKAKGKVFIRSKARKLEASADNAIYRMGNTNSTNNYLELIGNAKATQDGNTVQGNRLKLNNAKVAQAEGRVTIDYTPKPAASKVQPVRTTEEA